MHGFAHVQKILTFHEFADLGSEISALLYESGQKNPQSKTDMTPRALAVTFGASGGAISRRGSARGCAACMGGEGLRKALRRRRAPAAAPQAPPQARRRLRAIFMIAFDE